MPYRDPAEQRAYMRQKMRERRATAKTQEFPAVYPYARPSQGSTARVVIPDVRPDTRGPVIPAVIPGQPATVASDMGLLPSPARSPRRADRSAQDRRQLLSDYQGARADGHADTAALATALQRRTAAQQTAAQRAQRERYEREVLDLAPRFMIEARRRLSMGGCYSETDIWPAAVQLAAQHVKQSQAPRLPDPQRKLLAAPLPYQPEPAQIAGPVWMGRLHRAWAALGDGHAATREETAGMVRAMIAAVIRQPIPAPAPSSIEAPGSATQLSSPLSMPGALGVPVTSE